MWQYRVTRSPSCWTSTYQPQPRRAELPSTSQLPLETLQTTRMTVPAVAARIGVLRVAPRSTPSWAGRPVVRKPLTSPAATGSIQVPDTGGTGTADTGAAGLHFGMVKAP